MKALTLTLFLAIATLAGSTSMRAQELSNAAKQQMQERLTTIQQRLKLTPDQMDKAKPIFEKQFQQIKDIRDRYGDPHSLSMRTKMKIKKEVEAVQKDADSQLRNILSVDQIKELNAIREENREAMKERQ